jgi:hypothetical protein
MRKLQMSYNPNLSNCDIRFSERPAYAYTSTSRVRLLESLPRFFATSALLEKQRGKPIMLYALKVDHGRVGFLEYQPDRYPVQVEGICNIERMMNQG